MAKNRGFVVIAMGVFFAGTVSLDSSAATSKRGAKPSHEPTEAFDKQAATTVLSSVDFAKCRSTNATRGDGHVIVKFLPSGTVASAVIDKGPLMGTVTAKCVTKVFKAARIPAFKGEAVLVGKTFHFE